LIKIKNMANLTKSPLQDNYETVLSQEWDWQLGTVFVANAPDFTFPAWETTYIVADAWNSNVQIAEINSVDTVNNTVTVNNITWLELWEGISSTAQVHSTNARVIISDNFQFWKDIKTAINTKLDNDGWNTTTTFDLQVLSSAFRIRKDGSDMKFTDDNNSEISLSTIAAASGADEKVAVSATDTTPWRLDDKITDWDWITSTINNPAWDEDRELSVDLLTTNGLKFTTGKLDVEPATNTQVGTQRIATDAEATAWTLEDVSINPKQAKDNYEPKITTFDIEKKPQLLKDQWGSIVWSLSATAPTSSVLSTDYIKINLWSVDYVMYWNFSKETDLNNATFAEMTYLEFEFDLSFNASVANNRRIWFGNSSRMPWAQNNTIAWINVNIDSWEHIFLEVANWSWFTNWTASAILDTSKRRIKVEYDVWTEARMYINWTLHNTINTNLPTTWTMEWWIGANSNSSDMIIQDCVIRWNFS